jgi:hypothetical protein
MGEKDVGCGNGYRCASPDFLKGIDRNASIKSMRMRAKLLHEEAVNVDKLADRLEMVGLDESEDLTMLMILQRSYCGR